MEVSPSTPRFARNGRVQRLAAHGTHGRSGIAHAGAEGQAEPGTAYEEIRKKHPMVEIMYVGMYFNVGMYIGMSYMYNM